MCRLLTLASQIVGFCFFLGVPTALGPYDWDAGRRLALGSHAGDLAHGVVEGKAEDLEVEVDGVAGEVAFGPAPVAVFED